MIRPWISNNFPLSEMMAGKVAEIAKKINHLFQTQVFTKPKSFPSIHSTDEILHRY